VEPTPTPDTAEPTPDEESTEADATGADDEEEAPAWLWWLIGIAAVVAVLLLVWLMTRARKRRAWLAELEQAEGEVDWFAHTLLPELRQAGSLERVAGGWLVGAVRVGAVEDRLTVLESSARRDDDRARARGLRDAVRLARGRMQLLTESGPNDSWALDLDEVIAGLEAALGPRDTAART
jgi:hypothetical protein